ncbi:MAG TPA: PQQ-dependent sugar dehydrogenase, partial [Solirubrobacterales bacterium]|nr:PQQ-dependent sugar dehydrogenase [Solirubrobacterales bacterium]
MKRTPARAALLLACGVAALFLVLAATATASQLPSGFQDEPAISGLSEPTSFRFAPDGRVFVAEKTGLILVYDGIDDATPELFADLRTEVYDTGDRGILGLALDPEFDQGRPYVYVLYAYDHVLGDPSPAPRWGEPGASGDPCPEPKGADACLVSGRLVRLTAASGENHALPSASAPQQEQLVEGWCQQFSSHSIGDLQFGPEGALYASGGDGASFSATDIGQLGTPPNPCGDPPEEGGALRAQDVRTTGDPTGLNGAVIRIDPDTGAAWPDNPLSGPDENARRIVAFGFRNPFRFAIDPDTHEVYTGNVGWNQYEEIDRFNPDSGTPYNSGWPCYEGPLPQSNYENAEVQICEDLYAEPGGASLPFFSYVHREDVAPGEPCLDFRGSAVSGIAFYEDGPFPEIFHGAMFFADSVRGCVFYMLRGADGRPDPLTVTNFMNHSDPYSGVDLEVGPDGDLYYASLFTEEGGNEFLPGAIHRIHYSSGNQPPVARLSVDKDWSSPGQTLDAEFDASASTDADGDPLEYEWDLNGDGVYADAPVDAETASESFEDDENHTVAVRVVDPDGAFSVARVTVFPGDTPPEPEIENPQPSFKWSVGSPVQLAGSGEDAEDGTLPATNLEWVTRLAHCPNPAQPQACHVHPLQAFPDVASASFLAPDHDYPSYIELLLTAVDSRGLSAQRTVKLDPRAVELEFASNPPGVKLTAGLVTATAPFDLTVIKGSEVVVSAPASALFDGASHPWLSWSDGGARVHSFAANASTRYTANYVPVLELPPVSPAETPTAIGPVAPRNAAPRLRLRKHPRKRAHGSSATFAFSYGGEASGFRCRIDRRAAVLCESPKTYRRLSPGPH